MKIAVGSDHHGFYYKNLLCTAFNFSSDITWLDCGTYSDARTDYPIYAHAVANLLGAEDADCGILFCGSGVGMAITANRYPGIYAAVAWNSDVARIAKEDDNVNVLVIPADFVSEAMIFDMVSVWLRSSFKEHEYRRRITMIDEI